MKTAFLRICLTITVMATLAGALPISGQTPGTSAISGIAYDPGNRAVANAKDFLLRQGAAQSGSPLGLSNVGLSIAGGGNNVIARMPVQGLSPGSLFTESVFIANYSALQTSVTKRLVDHADQALGQCGDGRC
jgi:hypothetical protein